MFPVMLNLTGKNAIIFGGGEVSERRAMKLLNSGAKVTVISIDFTDKLEKITSENLKLIHSKIKNENVKDYLKNADLVLIATSDNELNNRIEEESHKRGLFVNRSDKISDFIMPAVLDTGDVSIAISTRGKSPAVAKAIKKRIKKLITKEDVLLIELEDFLKHGLKDKIRDQKQRKAFLREIIIKPEIIQCLKDHNIDKAKVLATKYLED